MNYPIVLAHGIAPFDKIYRPFLKWLPKVWSHDPDKYHYFKGIASHLSRHGFTVFAPRVDFAGSVSQRANELAHKVRKFLEETGFSKVHVIAHSMGGLDARHMIVDEDMQDTVATLTTIGTPHLGTSFADQGLELTGGLIDYVRKMDLDLRGFKDLQTDVAIAFNQRAQKAEAGSPVHYVVYASKQDKNRVFSLLQPSWEIIHETEGENDGLTSVASQSWVPTLIGDDGRKAIHQKEFPIEADHLNELGWWDPDELHGIRWWWFFNLKKKIQAFEDQVKAAYLKMAEDAERLVGG